MREEVSCHRQQRLALRPQPPLLLVSQGVEKSAQGYPEREVDAVCGFYSMYLFKEKFQTRTTKQKGYPEREVDAVCGFYSVHV